jgi:hypothetical protein
VHDGTDHFKVAQFFCTYIINTTVQKITRTRKTPAFASYASSEAMSMAKKTLHIEARPEVTSDGAFVRYFQTQLVLLLKARGLLSETQSTQAISMIGKVRA